MCKNKTFYLATKLYDWSIWPTLVNLSTHFSPCMPSAWAAIRKSSLNDALEL